MISRSRLSLIRNMAAQIAVQEMIVGQWEMGKSVDQVINRYVQDLAHIGIIDVKHEVTVAVVNKVTSVADAPHWREAKDCLDGDGLLQDAAWRYIHAAIASNAEEQEAAFLAMKERKQQLRLSWR